ncbi:hypothetical protein, partial [Escherichia coli]|uniref:hypothetical protein n=1 Tax=Escherichia coli TaxID=562 RepID=UPI00300523EB
LRMNMMISYQELVRTFPKRVKKKRSPKLDCNCLILWIEACSLLDSKKHAKFAINLLNIKH